MSKNHTTQSKRIHLVDNIYILSAVLVIGVFYFINPRILSLYSLQNITLEIAPLLCMALGIGFVLYTGSIDLSTGALASAACVITGLNVGHRGEIVVVLVLLMGACAGAFNGWVVAKLKVPSFIATLCAMSIWQAIAIVLSGGGSRNIPMDQRKVVAWASEKLLYLPIMFWLSILFVLLCLFLERRTKIGKMIFATGANERAARLAGVNTTLAKITALMLSSLGSAMAGVMYAYKLKSSVPTIGNSLNLMAISAVALGGTLMSGGKGGALRSLIGVITIIFISSGMNLVKVDPLWMNIVYGVVLIFAVAVNSEKGDRNLMIK